MRLSLGSAVVASLALVAVGAGPERAQAPATVPPPTVATQPTLEAYVEAIPNTKVKFEMVPIPAGTFLMGSPAGEAGRADDEGPQVTVAVPAFWMGRFEVTWNEYDLFAFARHRDATPVPAGADAVTQPTPPYADESFGYGKGRQPALSITHHAAMEYCRWLSARTGKTYRLPTEAEWEYACRAGATTRYSFGDDEADLAPNAWSRANADDHPHPVGQKKPNAWGLFDMHGNLAEWVLDTYDAQTYATWTTSRRPRGGTRGRARRASLSSRRARRLVGRSPREAPVGRPAVLGALLESARSPAAPEHLVADRRHPCRLPSGSASRRAEGTPGPEVQGHETEPLLERRRP